jgi:hypothetical protein
MVSTDSQTSVYNLYKCRGASNSTSKRDPYSLQSLECPPPPSLASPITSRQVTTFLSSLIVILPSLWHAEALPVLAH